MGLNIKIDEVKMQSQTATARSGIDNGEHRHVGDLGLGRYSPHIIIMIHNHTTTL